MTVNSKESTLMNCPACGYECVLVIVGQDEYGVIREWVCLNEDCLWCESDEEN